MNPNFVDGDAGTWSVPMTVLGANEKTVTIYHRFPAVTGDVVGGFLVFFLGLTILRAGLSGPRSPKIERQRSAATAVLGVAVAMSGVAIVAVFWGKVYPW